MFDPLPPRPSHLCAKIRVTQDANDPIGKTEGVVGPDKESRHAVDDRFSHCALWSADNRKRRGHRLQHDPRRSFGTNRNEDEKIGPPQEIPFLLVADPAEEADVPGKTESLDKTETMAPVLVDHPVSSELDDNIAETRNNGRECGQHDMRSLVLEEISQIGDGRCTTMREGCRRRPGFKIDPVRNDTDTIRREKIAEDPSERFAQDQHAIDDRKSEPRDQAPDQAEVVDQIEATGAQMRDDADTKESGGKHDRDVAKEPPETTVDRNVEKGGAMAKNDTDGPERMAERDPHVMKVESADPLHPFAIAQIEEEKIERLRHARSLQQTERGDGRAYVGRRQRTDDKQARRMCALLDDTGPRFWVSVVPMTAGTSGDLA